MKVSVFTVMIGKDYDLEQTARLLAEHGYAGVEWRVAPDWHVNPEKIEEDLPKAAAIARDHGLELPAIATYLTPDDPLAPRVLKAAGKAGIKRVRVGGFFGYDSAQGYSSVVKRCRDGLQALVPICLDTGTKALVEIHHGTIVPTAAHALKVIDWLDPHAIGVTHDAGNMIHEGIENHRMSMDILGPYLAHIHVKNAHWVKTDEGWRSEWAHIRDGIVDYHKVVEAANEVGYKGWYSFEDFHSDPVETKLRDDIAYARELFAE